MYEQEIKKYLQLEVDVIQQMDIKAIDEAMQLIKKTYENEGRIFVFGNGGSSATASHWQNDFNKGISEYVEKKFHFMCLNDNMATVMAIANDIGFEEVFRFQLRGNLCEDDIVLAISGSGNSANVINAVEYAKECGNKVIGMTGYDGGRLRQLSDISLHVPVKSMQITEDLHMMLDHLIMATFYKVMCGKEHIGV